MFLTTQFDVDNGLPANEQPSFIREQVYEEEISHAGWNSREPIFYPEAGGPEVICKLCKSAADAFCKAAPDLVAKMSDQVTLSDQMLPEFEHALVYADSVTHLLPAGQGAELKSLWGGNMTQIERTMMQLDEQKTSLESQMKEWCSG